MRYRKSILKLLLFACLTIPLPIFSQSDTLELPLIEDWSSALFQTNGWVADSGWTINANQGNPQPAAFFNARNYTEQYNKYLTTALIDATSIAEGDIFLKFDVKLRSNNPDNYGKLYIKIEFEGGYREIIESFVNIYGSFDWQQSEINISKYSKGRRFNIFIQAIGDPNAVDDWSVDNIHIYRVCEAPKNLEVEIDTLEEENYQLNFTWEMNEPDPGEWLHWDDGVHAGGISVCPDCIVYVAARWDPEQLIEYDGFRISKIKAFLNDTGYDSLEFHIWTGELAANEIYNKEHDTLIYGDWIEHFIDTSLYLDASKENWFGYRIHQCNANFPLGYDPGPAIAGYGDMISTSGNVWDRLSDFGFDNNWLIHIYLVDSLGQEIQVGLQRPKYEENRSVNLSGYYLYKSINGSNFELLEFFPWVSGDTTHSIVFDASIDNYCYQLTALWASETDTCESAPAISKDNPEEDFVCVLLVGDEENRIEQTNLVRCFPNPFNSKITFEYQLEKSCRVEIRILDAYGKQVDVIQQNQFVGKQTIVWEALDQQPGFYTYVIRIGDIMGFGKLILQK